MPPEKGYGAVNPDAYHTVPAEKIPEEARTVGAVLMAQGANGQQQDLIGRAEEFRVGHPLETAHPA